ncbi:hypothetical protein HO173_004740 [Letharia columbiana]|uniref:DUF7918 domain-containing protein n=1 Tax=Letharia columbiana TaxID=112416 RepID=A0A8H6L6F8_9LECA|nr:uncharacterized protein HO173_004740 [Letharia columbiana]KAF6237271.1 hypothetical protein HO173_004740 [Letharia columbiana]
MDHFQGITAQIISNGQVLDFYDDPDAPEIPESRARHHYVEAVAGSTFQVKVNLTHRFNSCGMKAEDAVKISVVPDGNNRGGRAIKYTKKLLRESFSRVYLRSHTFTGPKHFCKETGQWMQSDYSFGNLVLKETPDPGFSVKQAEDLGKIQITVERIKVEERQVAYVPSTIPIETINEVPEKALKGRSIETTVRLANTRPTSASIHSHISKSISGEAGKPVVFNIYYRSRRALQMMGCIPRSPSPESQSPDDDATAPEHALREVRDLRARLALLERGLNVKSESSSAATGVKREREEEGNEGSRQRRRTTVKIEHVDLTDD